MKKFEIYKVNLGKGQGSEHSGTKYCVIIQNNTGNKYSPTTTIVPITSKSHNKSMKTHVTIKDVLPLESYIVCEQIRTIDKSRMLEYVCTLPGCYFGELERAVRVQLGLGG